MTPRLSVLMTVFNGGSHLEASVGSILGQSFRDFEFVIVEDASTDGSGVVLEGFAARDARIRLIRNPTNSGQTACLNQGLAACRADWIARQDADDLSAPERFEKQWERIGHERSLVLLGTNGWIITPDGGRAGMIHVPVDDTGIRWAMPFRNPFIHAAVVFRRLRPDGTPVRYDPAFRICQDWELWSRLVGDGPVANLPGRLVSYRHSSGSLSNNNADTTRRESGEIVARLWKANFPDCNLRPQEAVLLQNFRDGLGGGDWAEFRRFYGRVRREWACRGHIRSRSAEAMHMLQAAGALALSSPHAAASAIGRALLADPLWTAATLLHWVVSRA